VILGAIFSHKHDPQEPPYISPTIPYIGHLIGLLMKRYEYYVDLSNKYKLPIYRLAIPGLPGGRVYIINSPALVLAVQRQPKKLSFWAVEATFAVGLAGLSKYAEKELQDNVTGEEPRPSLFMDAMQCMHQKLQPSEALDQMTRIRVDSLLTRSIEMFNHTGSTSIELYRRVNIAVTYAVTDGVSIHSIMRSHVMHIWTSKKIPLVSSRILGRASLVRKHMPAENEWLQHSRSFKQRMGPNEHASFSVKAILTQASTTSQSWTKQDSM